MLEKLFYQKLKFQTAKSVYELVKTEHGQILVCKECGFIEDIILEVTDVFRTSFKK